MSTIAIWLVLSVVVGIFICRLFAIAGGDAAWADGELGLTLRGALIPVADIRKQGRDVRVARYGPSDNLSYAMFSGGGLAWTDAAVKRGEFAVTPAPPGEGPDSWPDLTGLSCRIEEFRAERSMILTVLVLPAPGADTGAYRALTEEIVALVEKSPNAGRPIPAGGPQLGWPPQGVALETHTLPGGSPFKRARVLARTLLYFLVMRAGLRGGGFVPARYLRQVVENSDFRKFDDGLRMIIDCTSELADALERRLAAAAAAGTVRYGLHRQDAAMTTCFTPAPTRSDHVPFIDGAQGGYGAKGGDRHIISYLSPTERGKQERRPHIPDFASASAPALATCASCADSAPETPIAPTILPSTTTGMPPSSGVIALSASSRMPAPPAAMASSSALLGRLNSSAVRALPSDTEVAESCALSTLWNITKLPPLSRMVMATCQEFLAASSSAAAMARLAWLSVIGGP